VSSDHKHAVKVALTVGAGAAIGIGLARGLPHHAAAPAPAPPPGSGSAAGVTLYDVLIVLIIGGLVAWAIHLRHKRSMRELHIKAAELDGFTNVRHSQLGDLWRCPDCHALILMVDIDDHQTESACADYVARLAELDAADDADAAEPASYRAEQVAAASTEPPEHSLTAGDYDTFTGSD